MPTDEKRTSSDIISTENVRDYAWVVDMDIKSFFDEVSHELLEKALERHVPEHWVKLYIKRWLAISEQTGKTRLGTPQGGVISPLLANLYLHYAFDKWLEKKHPKVSFVRYADDIIIHCHTEQESLQILKEVTTRLKECGLRLNEEKTHVVHCLTDKSKKVSHYKRKFDFLGFSFKPTTIKASNGNLFTGTDCIISQKSEHKIIEKWKSLEWHRNPGIINLQQIAISINPQIRGLMNYFGKINHWSMRRLFKHLHYRLMKWILRRYKRFKGSHKRAYAWLRTIKCNFPNMFYHWQFFKHLG